MIVNDLLPRLNDIQRHFGYLPLPELTALAAETGASMAAVTSAATFYSGFRTKPAGKHLVRVCIGAACHVKGAEKVHDAFRRELAIAGDDDTSADRLFTVTKVACLGCCMLAVAVQIDDHIFGWVEPATVPDVIRDFLHAKADELAAADSRHATTVPASASAEARVCRCSSCRAAGAEEVWRNLRREAGRHGLPAHVREVSCTGKSYRAPEVTILSAGHCFHYPNVQPDTVARLLQEHFTPQGALAKLRWRAAAVVDAIYTGASACLCQSPTLAPDRGDGLLIATERGGESSPLDLEDYRRSGGFAALDTALDASPEAILAQLDAARLRGRGGAGFPTARKWRLAMETTAPRKTVVCNADEGDPGAFMDRMILESFPFRVLEGILIAARVIAAQAAVIYIREEYSQAVDTLMKAIDLCRRDGRLARLGPDFDIVLFRGAGAFVCGEETALLESLEGRRGIPRRRPPFPTTAGLFGQPTLINNVETFACVPWIIRHGGDAFARHGTTTSAGTKTFALAGKIRRGGLIEVPMGTTIRTIVEDIGGGAENDHQLKAVLIGGPSGGCLPAALFDLPVDYEALTAHGAMMGSGGLVVLDERDCLVDIAAYFLDFTRGESCGKCTLCREGLQRLHAMIANLTRRHDAPLPATSLDDIQALAQHIRQGALCGLGRTAPNMILSAIRYFRREFEAHLQGHCPTGKCRDLGRFEITEKCIGCTKCVQHCAAGAIPFTPFEQHHINQELCVRCGVCRDTCPQHAIITTAQEPEPPPDQPATPPITTAKPVTTTSAPAGAAGASGESAATAPAGANGTAGAPAALETTAEVLAEPPPAEPSAVITLDGKVIPWQANQTILQLAAAHDIAIPTLCHLPGCQENARCLVCSVYDRVLGLFVPACDTLALAGHRYENDTPSVAAFRRRAVELLLDRHDLRCGACAKKDTCLLRFLMRTFRARKTTPNPATTTVVATGRIAFYPERCVLCGRCVALSRQRDAGLCFHHRGGKTQVAPPWGQTWEQATDNLAEELIDICPVGALCQPPPSTT